MLHLLAVGYLKQSTQHACIFIPAIHTQRKKATGLTEMSATAAVQHTAESAKKDATQKGTVTKDYEELVDLIQTTGKCFSGGRRCGKGKQLWRVLDTKKGIP